MLFSQTSFFAVNTVLKGGKNHRHIPLPSRVVCYVDDTPTQRACTLVGGALCPRGATSQHAFMSRSTKHFTLSKCEQLIGCQFLSSCVVNMHSPHHSSRTGSQIGVLPSTSPPQKHTATPVSTSTHIPLVASQPDSSTCQYHEHSPCRRRPPSRLGGRRSVLGAKQPVTGWHCSP